MSLTKESVAALFAPLSDSATAPQFFGAPVSPAVSWTWGAPGSTHPLAGKYDNLGEFYVKTFGLLATALGCECSWQGDEMRLWRR